MKLLIYSMNTALDSASLYFKMPLNIISSLDFKGKHLQRIKKKRDCLEGIGHLCTAWEFSSWDSNTYSTDVTDKDRSYIRQARTDCVLYVFL